MEYRTEDVWATPHVAGKNVVRQLLVPAYDNVEALEAESGLELVSTPFGQWPVTRAAELPTEVMPLAESPHLGGGVSVVVGGCRWSRRGGPRRGRGARAGGRSRRRG